MRLANNGAVPTILFNLNEESKKEGSKDEKVKKEREKKRN